MEVNNVTAGVDNFGKMLQKQLFVENMKAILYIRAVIRNSACSSKLGQHSIKSKSKI
jgi:hypothetical protein